MSSTVKSGRDAIIVERDGHIATITINRPERRNAIDPPTTRAFDEIWDEIRDDDDIWAVVLTGAGDKAFCVGADLKWRQDHPDQNLDSLESLVGPNGFAGLVNRKDMLKPIIAAVKGYCLGGGFELALACDFIIAHPEAKFGLPEPRVGYVACWGGVQRIARSLPRSAANRVLLAGEFLSASQAQEWGLVYEVCSDRDVVERGRELAESLCKFAPLALQATKGLYLSTLDQSLSDAIASAPNHPAMKRLQESEDQREGQLAFKERREPKWTGR